MSSTAIQKMAGAQKMDEALIACILANGMENARAIMKVSFQNFGIDVYCFHGGFRSGGER